MASYVTYKDLQGAVDIRLTRLCVLYGLSELGRALGSLRWVLKTLLL